MREKELKKRAERGENDVKGKEKRFEHWQIIAAYIRSEFFLFSGVTSKI